MAHPGTQATTCAATPDGAAPRVTGPESPTPWRYEMEDHLGSPAYSIFDADGERLAVGFLRQDAKSLCETMNGVWS